MVRVTPARTRGTCTKNARHRRRSARCQAESSDVSSEQPDETSSPPTASAALAAGERLDPEVRTLAAGPWTMELVGDELGNIAYGGRPVLRAVKAVVRDQDWNTLEPSVQDLEVGADGQGLRISFKVSYAGH